MDYCTALEILETVRLNSHAESDEVLHMYSTMCTLSRDMHWWPVLPQSGGWHNWRITDGTWLWLSLTQDEACDPIRLWYLSVCDDFTERSCKCNLYKKYSTNSNWHYLSGLCFVIFSICPNMCIKYERGIIYCSCHVIWLNAVIVCWSVGAVHKTRLKETLSLLSFQTTLMTGFASNS